MMGGGTAMTAVGRTRPYFRVREKQKDRVHSQRNVRENECRLRSLLLVGFWAFFVILVLPREAHFNCYKFKIK